MKPLYPTLTLLLVALLPLSNTAVADNMYFTGNLISQPSCTISDKGGRMDVRFNNIAINKIDGELYRQTVPYQLDCPGASTSKPWRMRLTLTTNPAHFESTALQTSVKDLGIKVSLGGIALSPNHPQELNIDPLSLPRLEAVPVKANDAKLSSIDFNATALLTAEFY